LFLYKKSSSEWLGKKNQYYKDSISILSLIVLIISIILFLLFYQFFSPSILKKINIRRVKMNSEKMETLSLIVLFELKFLQIFIYLFIYECTFLCFNYKISIDLSKIPSQSWILYNKNIIQIHGVVNPDYWFEIAENTKYNYTIVKLILNNFYNWFEIRRSKSVSEWQ
jgi:hypothetical protein